jgi:hypothetical protein
MKTTNNKRYLALGAALLFFQDITLHADDLFQVFWRGTYYVRNSSSHVIAVSFTERTLVQQMAQNAGLDPSQLVLVYRVQVRTGTRVVDATNAS